MPVKARPHPLSLLGFIIRGGLCHGFLLLTEQIENKKMKAMLSGSFDGEVNSDNTYLRSPASYHVGGEHSLVHHTPSANNAHLLLASIDHSCDGYSVTAYRSPSSRLKH